ncbi:MAG: phosphatase PAP2 family protein [Anaerolineae bacterium]|nr:phosphatase PAP2 family protein [Anaerolineae bacterium]
MGQIELGWGLDIILWFQSWRTPLVTVFFSVFDFAGQAEFYLLVLPLIYWCFDAVLGQQLGLFFMISYWSNSLFKSLWKRPRPYMVSKEVNAVMHTAGYGIPSGHTQGATQLWGFVALKEKRRWVTIAASVWIALMAISRMALGEHYPQDVAAGLAIGLLWLGGYAWFEPKLIPWIKDRGLSTQIALVVGAAAVMLVLHPLVIRATVPPMTPPDLTYDDLISPSVTSIAAFLGLGIGFALETRYVRFDAGGKWWKRGLRFLLGFLGVIVLRYGLKVLLGDSGPVILLRMIRYSLIGLWAGFGAPLAFVKIGLATRRGGTAYVEQ